MGSQWPSVMNTSSSSTILLNSSLYYFSMGDVNGDNISDILLGAFAYGADDASADGAVGRAFVVFGRGDLPQQLVIDNTLIEAGHAVQITAGSSHSNLGALE